MTILARDNVPLGHVADVASNYVIMEEGLLRPAERYVPLAAIANVDEEDRVHLLLSAADAATQSWSTPPVDDVDYRDYGASRAADFESGD